MAWKIESADGFVATWRPGAISVTVEEEEVYSLPHSERRDGENAQEFMSRAIRQAREIKSPQPCQARAVLLAFRNATKTASLNRLAPAGGGKRVSSTDADGRGIRYEFPDGSALETRGRGRDHRVTVEEPSNGA